MSKNKLNKFHFPHPTLLFCAAVLVAPPERPWISSDLGRAAGHLAPISSDFIPFVLVLARKQRPGEVCKAGSPLKVKLVINWLNKILLISTGCIGYFGVFCRRMCQRSHCSTTNVARCNSFF